MGSVSIFRHPILTSGQAQQVELALRDRIEQLTERRALFERHSAAVRFAADVIADIETCQDALLAMQGAACTEGLKS